MRAGLLAAFLALCACGPIRVAPVGDVAPDPKRPGVQVMNPALPQPDPADYQGGGLLNVVRTAVETFAPSPYREGILGLLSVFFVARGRRYKRALSQTVGGIEAAKRDRPEIVPAIHSALAETQDEDAKRVVWEMRP